MGDGKKGSKCPSWADADSGHTGRGPAGRCRACYAAAAAVAPLGPFSSSGLSATQPAYREGGGRGTVRATAAALRRGELHFYAVVAFLDPTPTFLMQSAPAWVAYNGAQMVLPTGPEASAPSVMMGAEKAVLRLKNWHHYDDPSETQPSAPVGLINFVLGVVDGLDVPDSVHLDLTGLNTGEVDQRRLLTVGHGESGVETAVCAVKTDSGTVEVSLYLYRDGDVDVAWDGPASCTPLRHGKNHWWSEHDAPGKVRQASAVAHFDGYGDTFQGMAMSPFSSAEGTLGAWLGPLGQMGRVLGSWAAECAAGKGFSFAASFVQFEYMGDVTHAQTGPDFAFDPYRYHRDRNTELGVEPRVTVAELLENLPRERRAVEIRDPASLAELMCADEPTFGQRMTGTDRCPVCDEVGCVYWEHWK